MGPVHPISGRAGRRLGIRGAAFLVCVLMASGMTRGVAGTADTVADIAAFVRWPDSAAYGLSFRLCLRDDDPALGQFMRKRGAKLHGKPITIHSLRPGDFGQRPCHLVYFSEGFASPTILERLRHRPVLTVSPQPGFTLRGGLVELNRETGRLVLVIDRAAVVGHPLTFSAQLLAISHQAGQ